LGCRIDQQGGRETKYLEEQQPAARVHLSALRQEADDRHANEDEVPNEEHAPGAAPSSEQAFDAVLIADQECQSIAKSRETADRRIILDRSDFAVDDVVISKPCRDRDCDSRSDLQDKMIAERLECVSARREMPAV
jgi:hypothetical protein